MNFLADLLAKLTAVFLNWGQAQAEKPPETKDANTPKDVRDAAGGAAADWMRNKDNNRHQH